MEYDFFDENNQSQKEENNVQRVPTPSEIDKSTPKSKMKWGKVILYSAIASFIFFCGMFTTWAMLDPEMRTLIAVKNRIQEEYYKEVTDEDFYKAIFSTINDDLLDAYSRYMTPEEFYEMVSEMDGNRIGVGLAFNTAQENQLCITRVCGNSPAEAAGLVVGDTIVGCGRTESDVSPCKTFEEFSLFLEDFGEKEDFFLQLRFNGEDRVVKLHKAEYVENNVFYRTNSNAYGFTGKKADVLTEIGKPMACLDEDTAYIQLVQFTGNADLEFDLAMEQFQKDGKKNLILDLRENGGGYLDIMQSIASYFCKTATAAKPVVAVADFGESSTKYRAHGNYYNDYFVEDSRICVLADKYSASASECLLGCMLDYGAIGYEDICLIERNGVAKTYGKGIMQQTMPVNIIMQDAITLTTAEIRWPVSNNSIHGRGILPQDGTLIVAENIDQQKETENAIKALWK